MKPSIFLALLIGRCFSFKTPCPLLLCTCHIQHHPPTVTCLVLQFPHHNPISTHFTEAKDLLFGYLCYHGDRSHSYTIMGGQLSKVRATNCSLRAIFFKRSNFSFFFLLFLFWGVTGPLHPLYNLKLPSSSSWSSFFSAAAKPAPAVIKLDKVSVPALGSKDETLNSADFMVRGLVGQTVIKEPGSIRGQQFVIENCQDCDIYLLDHTAQVTDIFSHSFLIFKTQKEPEMM